METQLVTDDLRVVWRDGSTPQEYEKARTRVFSARYPNRFPTAIARPRTEQQIVASIKLAEQLGVRVSIRSGGHSWAFWSIRQDTVLIDLIDYKRIEYDDKTKTVSATSSVTGAELSAYLGEKSRFLPLGHCGGVALGGFVLQGGMGINCRSYGYTCEYLVGIDVVTAKGEHKHCDEFEHVDLFWAARGAGPAFPAVVTRFHFRTMAAPTMYKRNLYLYPISLYDTVIRWMITTIPTISDDIQIAAISLVPHGDTRRLLMVQSTCFADSESDALSKLAPLITTHPPGAVVATDCEDTTFQREYEAADAAWAAGHRYIADTVWLHQDVDMASICRPVFADIPDCGVALWTPMRPVSRRTNPPAMAMTINTDYYISLYAIYPNASDDDVNEKWVKDSMKTLLPNSVGTYIGEHDLAMRPAKYWSEEAEAKLRDICNSWDPDGRICGKLEDSEI